MLTKQRSPLSERRAPLRNEEPRMPSRIRARIFARAEGRFAKLLLIVLPNCWRLFFLVLPKLYGCQVEIANCLRGYFFLVGSCRMRKLFVPPLQCCGAVRAVHGSACFACLAQSLKASMDLSKDGRYLWSLVSCSSVGRACEP